jgi:hypothetical protein
VLETGKRPSREQHVDRDAIRHRVTAEHSGDATGRASPQGEPHSGVTAR